MISNNILRDEACRQAAVDGLMILDTAPEEEFDALVRVASLACDVPICLIGLLDGDRQWFKAKTGLPDISAFPRNIAFCDHVVASGAPLVVPDALADPRFAENPLVTDAPHIRFYAGAPLRLTTGHIAGTICLIDQHPRELSEPQRAALMVLAEATVHALEHRRQENLLQGQYQRLAYVLEAGNAGSWEWNIETGALHLSDRWATMLGKEPDALRSMTFLGLRDHIHPDDVARVDDVISRHIAGKIDNIVCEARLRHEDGHWVWLLVRGRVMSWTAKNEPCLMFGINEDITERKRREELSRRNEAFLERTSQLAGIGGWEIDLQTNEPTWSDEMCRIHGLPPGARPTLDEAVALYTPEVRPIVRASVEKGITEGTPWDMEVPFVRANGAQIWLRSVGNVELENGVPVRLTGTIQDITERRQRETLSRQNEEFLERTSRLAGIGGWEIDVNTKEISWSDEMFPLHGVPRDFHPSVESVIALHTPKMGQVIGAAIQRAMTEGAPWDLEVPFVRANGDQVWLRSVGNVERKNGMPFRLVGVIQDISERLHAYQALQRANERANLATESGRIGIWDWDIVTGEMVWDAWMYRLYGLDPQSGPGLSEAWSTMVHPEDLARVQQHTVDALAENGRFEDIEFRIIQPDGNGRVMHVTGHLFRDSLGKPLRFVGTMYDVTEPRQLADALAKEHELLRVTLESIGDGVITTDARGLISWMNPVAERMTGWLTAEVEGQPLDKAFRIIDQTTGLAVANPVANCAPGARHFGLDDHTMLISRDGTEFGIEASAAPIQNKEGDVLGVVLVFNDVTAQRRISGEMTYRATHDALTDLLNRTELEVRLQRLLESIHESDAHHAFLFIDLDQFKLINDMCGHSAGDELLRQVGKLLSNAIRSKDTLARLGGDEFAIILDNCPLEQATRVAQQICDRMEVFRFQRGEQRFRIGASIGLVSVDSRWTTTAAIMQAADKSCYAAKEAGRNRFHIWFDTDQAMRDRHGEMQWATRIEQALDEGRFVLFGQRIVSLRHEAEGLRAEVLLRMRDADGTLIPPGMFLPAAERFHLISRVDRWVLLHVVEWLRSLPSLAAIEQLSVNVSGHSIGDRAFHRWANELLSDAGFEICRLLCFEITETATVTNMADATLFIDHVRLLGVRVALDDFGAGASSFGYLKTLPVDCLKIDGQFIQGLIDHPLDEATVRGFIDVARVVGVKTVAEFVDRREIVTRIEEMGVDLAQGFYIHRPEPLSDLTLGSARPDVMAAE